jgi:hypothetical protein
MTQDDSLSRGQLQIGQMLAIGTLRGLWGLEQFDHPPRRPAEPRSINVRTDTPWRNLASEWIAANPNQWDALLKQQLDAEANTPL